MASVSYVTRTFDHAPWFASAMSATMVPIKDDVLFVVDLEFLMRTTARNVQSLKKMYVVNLFGQNFLPLKVLPFESVTVTRRS